MMKFPSPLFSILSLNGGGGTPDLHGKKAGNRKKKKHLVRSRYSVSTVRR
jgi:hypothetical protein